MRPNRKRPESAPFWFQSLIFYCRPHGGLLHDRADALKWVIAINQPRK